MTSIRSGYDTGTAPSGYDVPRQQNADDYGYDEYGEEPPPWAGQSIYPAGPGRRERRPPSARRSDRPSEPGSQDWPDEDQEEDWQQEAWVREERAPPGPPGRDPEQEVQAQAARRGQR